MEEYIVVDGGRMQCRYGSIESTFLYSDDHGCKIQDKNPILDTNLNICDFLFCSLHKKSCVFKAVEQNWNNHANCGVAEGKYITTRSVLSCVEGGSITISDAGQNCVIEKDGVLKIVDFE